MTLDEFIGLSPQEKAELAGPAASQRRQVQQVQQESAEETQDVQESSAEEPMEPVVVEPAVTDEVMASESPAEEAEIAEPMDETEPEAVIAEDGGVLLTAEDVSIASGDVATESNARPAIIPIDGAAAGPLDLDIFTAVRMAVDSHPSVAESLGRLYQQNERVSVARAGYLPTVSSGISTGYRDSLGRSTESFNFSVSQMVYDFGKVSNAVDMEEFGVQRDQAGVLSSVDNLARDTARAFIEVQRYQRLVELAADQIESIGEIQQMAEQRAQLGASTRSDEMQAQSREQSAMAMRQQLQAELDGWKRALQNLVSMDRPIQVTGAFPEEMNNACEMVAEDYHNAPEVLMAEAELEEARASIEKARSDLFPTISLDLDYDNYFDESNNLNFPDIDEDVAISLSVNMDLFQGGAIRARKRAAEYALQAASAARESAVLGVSRRLLEAKDQTRSLSERLRFLGNQLQNIVDTQELYRQQYLSLGTRTLLDILNTEQEIYQSRFDRENTIRDLQRLQVECMHSVASIRSAFGVNVEQVQGADLNP